MLYLVWMRDQKPSLSDTLGDLPSNVKMAGTVPASKWGAEFIRDAVLLAESHDALNEKSSEKLQKILYALNHPSKSGFDFNKPVEIALLSESKSAVLLQLSIKDSTQANQTLRFLLNEMDGNIKENAMMDALFSHPAPWHSLKTMVAFG